MKALLVLEVLVLNIVLLYVYSLVGQDFASRLAYDRSIGMAPSVSYSVFTYVLSGSNGATFIPGLLTLDWSQVILVALVVVDAGFVISLLQERRQRAGRSQGPSQAPAPPPPSAPSPEPS